mmetsp:Transcript_27855/g.37219  ORF Transcript_27855/g.37219 Transcript_27855/m.37219 type:complete len:95 (+) Transcript_27855:1100-1384(+)
MACKALIARGEARGFSTLLQLLNEMLLPETEDARKLLFAGFFGKVITKTLSKKWATKERGYTNLSRFADQRLFNQVYPILEGHKESSFAMQLIL